MEPRASHPVRLLGLPETRSGSSIGEETSARIGTRTHFRWLQGIVAAVIVLNLFDAVLTIIAIYTHRAREANPMMADLVENEPWLFMAAKVALVSFGSLLLWRLRKQAFAVVAIFVAFLAYYFVLLYHLYGMNIHLLASIW